METARLFLLACALTVSACATQPPETRSGFLTDYDQLKPDPEDQSLLWWESEGFDWTNYKAVFAEPLSFNLPADSTSGAIMEADLQNLSNFFQETLVEQLGTANRLASAPEAGVLRASIMVTDINVASPALNALSTVLLLVPLDRGGASIEMAFYDGATGELVAMGIDRKTSQPIDFAGGFQRYGYARQALREWTEELDSALQTNP
ncbi:MAG: DUF3313 domain-containing protein [Hyphomonadaceae bacterium]|nr:DUF3313 domain-containing protein [Hyphomonadaceae bacterium]